MRVAIDARMAHGEPTGIGRVTLNLIENLPRLDSSHEYLVLSRDGGLRLPPLSNVRQVVAPFGHLSVRVQTGLPRLIRRSGADVVHHLFYVIPLASSVPFVVTIHDTLYSHFPGLLPRWRRPVYRFLMRYAMARSRRVICTSESTARDVVRFFPNAPASKMRVVHNGVESRFAPREVPDPRAGRASLGLPEAYVLYVGNHRGHKNLERLIHAFAAVKAEVPHALVLTPPAGRGAERTLRAVADAGVADRVLFRNMPDEELPIVYALADVFVYPSLYEGFGLPPLESMACGTPVVTSNVSSLPEVVGEAAVLVDPTSIEEIAGAIRRVICDKDLAGDLRSRGVERARLFSWESAARRTLEIYLQAAG